MMTYRMLIFSLWGLLVSGLLSCNKEKLSAAGVSESFDIASVETGTTYRITVSYPDVAFSEAPVPVVYLADGFWYKDMTAGIMADLSEKGEIPKAILVSIDYQKGDGAYVRSKDLVYPIENSGFKEPAGDKFFAFLKNELAPKVEQQYPCDTTMRTFVGHSLGGFFALYTLLEHAGQPFFKKVVAASCSLGLGQDNAVFVKEQEVAAQVTDIPATLFLSCGELVGSAPAMHEEFYRRFKGRNYPSLRIAFETYKKSHATDPFPSFKNGLKYVLNN